MKWKESLLGLLGISAPAIATKAQDTQPDSLNHKTEITQRPRFRNIEEPIPQNNNNLPPDTIDFQLLSETILPDSIYADTLNLDTLSTDSIAHTWNLMTPREKLQSCANQMLCFISQFEDIKAQSYYDNVGHKWTVGPGWTYINGKPVTSTTKIRNAEEMFTLWSNDLNKENGYFDRIEETLHLDKMLARTEEDVRKQQGTLCCFESLMWNCGPGVMGTKDKPSQLVASYNDF